MGPIMEFYYTDQQLADNAADELRCCGFTVTIKIENNLYILTAKEN